jgi:hypothetical protein
MLRLSMAGNAICQLLDLRAEILSEPKAGSTRKKQKTPIFLPCFRGSFYLPLRFLYCSSICRIIPGSQLDLPRGVQTAVINSLFLSYSGQRNGEPVASNGAQFAALVVRRRNAADRSIRVRCRNLW